MIYRVYRKLNNLSHRHQVNVLYAIFVEMFVRLYAFSSFRILCKIIFRMKEPERYIYVVGCYNSGTTIVKDAIAMHSKVCTTPVETDNLTNAIDSFENGEWPRCVFGNCYSVIDSRQHGSFDKKQYMSDLRPWTRTGMTFLDKSISNTLRIPKLRTSFSNAKFICVVREPEGVVRGIQKRSLPGSVASEVLGSNCYPDELLMRQWVFFYQLVLNDYKDKPEDIYFCSYERFVREPESELTSMLGFLGLDSEPLSYQDGCLKLGECEILIRQPENDCSDYLTSAVRIREMLDIITSRLAGGNV